MANNRHPDGLAHPSFTFTRLQKPFITVHINKLLRYLVGFLTLVATGLIVIQQARPAPMQTLPSVQPKIIWSSPDVYAGITSTTTVQKTLTFTADQPLQGVSLEAVPEIARFVQIQPRTFMQVPAGQPQTVRLTFTAPAAAQYGAFEGTIHVSVGRITLPQTLKTSVTFAVVPLPPDPGEAGKATLAGIDADGDGVRDDVQRYIALNVPDSARHRAALKIHAIATQRGLLAQNLQQSTSAAIDRINAIQCLNYLGKRKENRWKEILALTLNTAERIHANDAHNRRLGGQAFRIASDPLEQRTACTFNVEALPN